ncbi:asparaginase [Variovorax sp. J22R133]|uniref:asparaginase n=1 Tax=Variovorax brevis TaxID=3053503 RepID=UPI0025786429|nr:asparaginase [Variovorax sp. J22R133]MDM0112443.1 asparaginase [Variovorax sp. J22R133]
MGNKSQHAARRVVVLGTGGTIAGRASSAQDNIGYVAGQVGVSDLVAGIDVPDGIALVAEQVAQVDSKDMEFAIWCELAKRCAHWLAEPDVAGIVITHGTDTLEETAYFLHRVLRADKPVVVTCAMRPSTAVSPDGPVNVRDAIAVAATEGARGVVAVCARTVHAAADVQKVHTYRLDAFSSGDAGPVGFVEEGHVRLVRPWPDDIGPSAIAIERLASAAEAPRVEIVVSHANARPWLIDALVSERLAGVPHAAQGLILAATGNGTLHHEIEAAAKRAQEAGVSVLRATRCVDGRILFKPADTIPDAGALSPVKARIALLLDILSAES